MSTQTVFTFPSCEYQTRARDVLGRLRQLEGNGGIDPWKTVATPLREYAGLLRFQFDAYLQERSIAAGTARLKVLDIGVGTGDAWIRFLQEHPNINWRGTALSRSFVHQELRPFVVETTGADLAAYFEPNSFDVVVSHLSAYMQESQTLEAALATTRQGGELIMFGSKHALSRSIGGLPGQVPVSRLSYFLNRRMQRSFELLEFRRGRIGFRFGFWSLHIRKK